MTMYDYRVVRKQIGLSDDYAYEVYEVGYDKVGEIESISPSPVTPFGTTIPDIRRDLTEFQYALNKPVIDFETVVMVEKV
jgi:hypothetical protein